MRINPKLKKISIDLRRKGYSYSEILKEVPISKSTLSAWISKVRLKENQIRRLKKKLHEAHKHGADAKRKQRIEKVLKIKKEAISEIGRITNKQLFYMGIMLYWAEGTKEKEGSIGEGVSFTNSDPSMCKLFLKWTKSCLNISEDRIIPRIYIHESLKDKQQLVLKFWSKQVGIPIQAFKKTCFTRTKFSVGRRRKDNGKYYGQLRIRISKSTDLNRRVSGWVEGICLQDGV